MKPYRPLFPTVSEKRYIARLKSRQKSIRNLLDAALDELLKQIETREEQEAEIAKKEKADKLRQDGHADQVDAIYADDAARLVQVVQIVRDQANLKYPASDQTEFLTKIAKDTDQFTTAQQAKVFQRVMTLDVTSVFREQSEIWDAWVSGNVSLIKTIDDRYFEQIPDVINEAYRTGTNTRDLTKEIQGRFDVSEYNAERIARDQMGKLNADVTQARQEQVGVKEYMWVTSGDDRVRESHAELNGTIHSWNDPPEVDGERVHPGGPILCRCSGEPVLPGETGESVREMYGFSD